MIQTEVCMVKRWYIRRCRDWRIVERRC